VVPRGYRSSGSVDPQVCTSIISAYNAGINVRDTYLFPCPTCSKSASTQIGELVSYLKANCASQWSGRVWLDIEGSQYWLGSSSSNQAWYKQLKDACVNSGVRCGVYSSSSQWSSIFGSSSFCYGSDLPLWYAHYDNSASFSDFSKFGCWSSPHAKQYAGDATLCSMGVDNNYAVAF
jgi:GH25 family lysozyme M1 (1,4-beta-N-acetylmuramidase)